MEITNLCKYGANFSTSRFTRTDSGKNFLAFYTMVHHELNRSTYEKIEAALGNWVSHNMIYNKSGIKVEIIRASIRIDL